MLIKYFTTILLFATAILALPTIHLLTATPFTLSVRDDKHPAGAVCEKNDLKGPTQDYYLSAVPRFCALLPAAGKNLDGYEDFVGTVTLPRYSDSKKTIDWVFRISVVNPTSNAHSPQFISRERCETVFRGLVQEGVLGKTYCVPEGTQNVVVTAYTKTENVNPMGQIKWEMRPKRGQK
ncbi:hypothetical protein BCR34DRAFT_574031 [Clohesyomyces aquaticus]|uniref:Uncharacterized protein n=1 Tax=Clohesyomyces aquaticus TaxID=1231657 RepID=A0A1Y1YXB3_9PLEO|nr:hypothetical protein BCR34DRAFT_574031 [Clohesyomyces aquaticus]